MRNESVKKLDLLWTGPYTILELDSKGSNVIIEISRNKRTKVHVNRLKRYRSKTQK
jgi:RecB family endonuclease NucS